MTLTDHNQAAAHAPTISQILPLTVTWSSTAAPLTSRMNGHTPASDDERPGDRASVVVELNASETTNNGRAAVRVRTWIERGEQRVLADERRATGRITVDGGLVHLDIEHDDRRVLAVSLTDDDTGRLVYAQSPLLAEIGLGGGMYDPPTRRQSVADCQ